MQVIITAFSVLKNCSIDNLTFLLLRMLKFDMESKGTRDVPQVDQPDLYLPSKSELQMAQVGFAIGVPVKQIKGLLFSYFYSCTIFSTESRNCKTDC